jgi:hypothetical protein
MTGRTSSIAAVAVWVILQRAPAEAQPTRLTIPEILALAGRSTSGGSGIGSGIVELRDIFHFVDLAVRGVVGEPTTYMTDDMRDVLTDYPIVNPEFLFRAVSSPVPRPGWPPEATVTLRGGSVVVDGLTYTFVADALPSLEPGTECLFLLHYSQGRYIPAGISYGVFEIGEDLRPLTRKQGFGEELRGVPSQRAITDIIRTLGAR